MNTRRQYITKKNYTNNYPDYSSSFMKTISKVFVLPDINAETYRILSLFPERIANRDKSQDITPLVPEVLYTADGRPITIRKNNLNNIVEDLINELSSLKRVGELSVEDLSEEQLKSILEYPQPLANLSNFEKQSLLNISLGVKKIHEDAKRDEERANERVNTVKSIIGKNRKVKSMLDIGAGDGKLTIALSDALNIPPKSTYAIDNKLPHSREYVSLQYDKNGNIPLNNNSVDLVIMFVVLHHINPTDRIKLMSEVYRILSYNGVLVIREHDDNKSDDFFGFLTAIHVFWYIAEGETTDPLYLMSRIETQQLMEKEGLFPIRYSTYKNNNPQRLYYECYIKREKSPIIFTDPEAQITLQRYIDKFNLAAHTYDNYVQLVPENTRMDIDKILNVTPTNINNLWMKISKELAKRVLENISSSVTNINSADISDAISGLI